MALADLVNGAGDSVHSVQVEDLVANINLFAH